MTEPTTDEREERERIVPHEDDGRRPAPESKLPPGGILIIDPLEVWDDVARRTQNLFSVAGDFSPDKEKIVEAGIDDAKVGLEQLESSVINSERIKNRSIKLDKKGQKAAVNAKHNEAKLKKLLSLKKHTGKSLIALVHSLRIANRLTTDELKNALRIVLRGEPKFKEIFYRPEKTDVIFHFDIDDAKVTADKKAYIFLGIFEKNGWVEINQDMLTRLGEAALRQEERIKGMHVGAPEFANYLSEVIGKRSDHIIRGEIIGATVQSHFGHAVIDDYHKKRLHFKDFDDIWLPVGNMGLKEKMTLELSLQHADDIAGRDSQPGIAAKFNKVSPYGIKSIGQFIEEHEKLGEAGIDNLSEFKDSDPAYWFTEKDIAVLKKLLLKARFVRHKK